MADRPRSIQSIVPFNNLDWRVCAVPPYFLRWVFSPPPLFLGTIRAEMPFSPHAKQIDRNCASCDTPVTRLFPLRPRRATFDTPTTERFPMHLQRTISDGRFRYPCVRRLDGVAADCGLLRPRWMILLHLASLCGASTGTSCLIRGFLLFLVLRSARLVTLRLVAGFCAPAWTTSFGARQSILYLS